MLQNRIFPNLDERISKKKLIAAHCSSQMHQLYEVIITCQKVKNMVALVMLQKLEKLSV